MKIWSANVSVWTIASKYPLDHFIMRFVAGPKPCSSSDTEVLVRAPPLNMRGAKKCEVRGRPEEYRGFPVHSDCQQLWVVYCVNPNGLRRPANHLLASKGYTAKALGPEKVIARTRLKINLSDFSFLHLPASMWWINSAEHVQHYFYLASCYY